MRVEIRDKEINVETLIKPSNRNIYFRIKDNTLYLTIPSKFSELRIISLIHENEDRIYKLLLKNSCEKQKVCHIFGVPYEVKTEIDYNSYCEIQNEVLIIHTPIDNDKQKKNIFNLFLANLLKNYVNTIFDDIYCDFKDICITKPTVEYANVKTYFGKNYVRQNRIVLNINLARYDKLYIKSVIYHEFCHFKYLNHQSGFYKLYEDKFNNARRIQHELRSIKYNDLY